MSNEDAGVRLQPSLLEEARRLAEREGVGLDQLVNTALAEKLSALRTETYFRERAERADLKAALQVLDRAGVGRDPLPGDELPAP